MTSGSVFSRSRFRFRSEILLHLILAIFGLSLSRRNTITKVLTTSWYIMLCFGLATAARGPTRSTSKRGLYCTRTSDCRRDLGETCYKMYEGCSQGVCSCDPHSHARDKFGRCRKVRRGRDVCDASDKCPDGMYCYHNTCNCVVGEMTHDGDYCLRTNEKILGQSCSQSDDKCVKKSPSGYITDEVLCSDRVCQCTPGLKARGNSCDRHSIGEYGCVENHHCDGGSVCMDGYCKCPVGRAPIAGNTKCGKTGALRGLPVSAHCNEIEEQSYCDEGLVCHTCGTQGRAICVRSRVPHYPAPLYSSQGAPLLNPSPMCLLTAILAYIMLMR